MQTLNPPEPGQLYTSDDESFAVMIGAIDGAIIEASITEIRPEKTGGAGVYRRPVRLTADEWAELAKLHGLTLTSP